MRESPECRERSKASDRPRSGQRAARGSSSNSTDETPVLVTDGGLAESDYKSLGCSTVNPPSLCQTGLGYNYVRCQRGGRDDTVYIHQLCAIAAGEDPHEVFSDQYDCHHRLSIPTEWGVQQIDTPENIELKPSTHHRVGELLRYDEYSSEVPE